jgi:hypothetical protein
MDASGSTVTFPGTGARAARRADAGSVRLGERDVAGLLLCGDMYGAPYDLLGGFLGVRPDRLRGIVARWRHAGYAETGRLGPGPAWCWLTRPGLAVTGQRYAPARPALGRLAHIRAVLAARLWLQGSQAYRDGRAWWRSERRIRAAIAGRAAGHVPDAEVFWPELPGSSYAGQCWAIEAELTPKPLGRTSAIMSGLLTRTGDYQPGAPAGAGPRYQRVIYLAAPAARGVVDRAAAGLPGSLAARLAVRDLPPGAVLLCGGICARGSRYGCCGRRPGSRAGWRRQRCWLPPRRSLW